MAFNFRHLEPKIGEYNVHWTKKSGLKNHDQSPLKLLDKKGLKALMVGTSNLPTKTARVKLLNHLQKIFTNGKYSRLSDEVKALNPKGGAVKLKDLLGADGVELYIDAIKEEKNSKNYRKAVFLKSVKEYPGQRWKKKMVLWIGGPSASGKSFAMPSLIDSCSKHMKAEGSDKYGNFVVSIDGGIDRETSQIRQLVLQLALEKGYTGIKDLHKNTKLGVKYFVKKAALNTHGLSLAIPATFVEELYKGASVDMLKFKKKNNITQAFAQIKPDKNNPLRFKNSVSNMGSSRAWKTKNFPKPGTYKIIINNENIECESKKYNGKYFDLGIKASNFARKAYAKIVKKPIYLDVINDLMFVKKVAQKWVECSKGETCSTKLSARDFEKWKHYSSGHNTEIIGLKKGLDLLDWLKFMSNKKLLSPIMIQTKSSMLPNKRKLNYKHILGEYKVQKNISNEDANRTKSKNIRFYKSKLKYNKVKNVVKSNISIKNILKNISIDSNNIEIKKLSKHQAILKTKYIENNTKHLTQGISINKKDDVITIQTQSSHPVPEDITLLAKTMMVVPGEHCIDSGAPEEVIALVNELVRITNSSVKPRLSKKLLNLKHNNVTLEKLLRGKIIVNNKRNPKFDLTR